MLLIIVFLFTCEVVIQSLANAVSIGIQHGLAIEYPFFFRDIVIPYRACMRINAFEQPAMNSDIFQR